MSQYSPPQNSEETEAPIVKPWGLPTLTCLVVANMIGAGVYTSSGFALGDLHSRWTVMLVWLVGGAFALLGAICYGGLARKITSSGGEYLFLARAFHPLAGFMAGWISLTAGFSGAIAFAAKAFAEYWPERFADGTWAPWLPYALILGFGVLHLIGMTFGSTVQNILVAIKVVGLLGFVTYGIAAIAQAGASADLAPQISVDAGATETATGFSIAAFATSLMWISLSYAGYNAAIYVSGAAKNVRVVAHSMKWATLVVTLLYIALNGVILFGAPAEQLVGQPKVFQIAALSLGGSYLNAFITSIVLLSLATSVSAMMQVGPHVYAQMARDGALPRALACEEHQAPRLAIVLQIALALTLTYSAKLQELLDYLSFLLMLSSAATVAALLLPSRYWYCWRHRTKTPNPPDPADEKHVWGWPLTPALFVLLSLVIAGLALKFRIATASQGLLMALGVLPIGVLLYYLGRLGDSKSPSALRGSDHDANG